MQPLGHLSDYFLDPAQLAARPPGGTYLVLVPTGHFQGWNSQNLEQELFRALSKRLHATGITTLALPFHPRSTVPEPTEVFVEQQYRVLHHFLTTASALLSRHRVLLLGVSLGAHVLARYLADEENGESAVDHCVLVSFVLEKPVPVFAETPRLSLVYGANDWIAYPTAAAELIAISPQEYGPRTSQLLQTLRTQRKEVFVAEGCGHFLECPSLPRFDTGLNLLTSLLR